MSKLIMMLRVKDGIFFVHDWLNCFEKLVDEIVVVDNGSTDGTYEVLHKHPKVVDIVRTEGFNEGRDKNLLYTLARKRKPDWCLWLDVDELFEPGVTRADLDRLMKNKFVNRYGFRRFHFIDREHFAGSGTYFYYTCIHDRILWRESPEGYFENFILDSPNVKGIKGVKVNTTLRIKHMGYINKELVDRKVDIYRNLIDPEVVPVLQKMYLNDVKKIRWHDDRKSVPVRLLTVYLNCVQLVSLVPRGVRKVSKMIKSRLQRPETQAVQVS